MFSTHGTSRRTLAAWVPALNGPVTRGISPASTRRPAAIVGLVSDLDTRSPALVSADFRVSIATRLGPFGFVPRAQTKALVRKKAKNTHRISFSSSHYNAPGHVAAFVQLEYEDAETRRLVARWHAGGQLAVGFSAEEVRAFLREAVPPPSRNKADPWWQDWIDWNARWREVGIEHAPVLVDALENAGENEQYAALLALRLLGYQVWGVGHGPDLVYEITEPNPGSQAWTIKPKITPALYEPLT